jgi:D-alanyl-D-alanine carboxypeptidase
VNAGDNVRVIAIIMICAFVSACAGPNRAAMQSSPPVAAVSPSVDPQAEAIAKELLVGTLHGAVDRTKLSKRIDAQLTPAMVQGAAKSLASLGKLTGFTLLRSRTVIGPVTHKQYTYDTFLATFQKQKLHWWVAFGHDGKVEGMFFSPDVARMSAQQLIPALQAQLQHDSKAGRFSGAALLARNGKTVFAQAYGLADRAKKIPNTLETRFRIGSMNKMFTAVAVLQLVAAGKIGLSDPLGKYLPDYPNKDVATKVTIHDLLTHTGGTGDIFGPEFSAHRLELRTLNDYVRLYGKRGLKFTPGSRWEYSSYGFILLGLVVANVSGQSYYDYVRDRIYQPAGMTATGSDPEGQHVPNTSIGYTDDKGALRPNVDSLPYRGTSAGGGYTTVEDLLRFANALQGNTLLDAAHTQLLTEGKVDIPGAQPDDNVRYAYGFMDQEQNGVRCFGHDGGAPGMNGALAICSGPGYTVIVLANMDPPAAQDVADFVTMRLPKT